MRKWFWLIVVSVSIVVIVYIARQLDVRIDSHGVQDAVTTASMEIHLQLRELDPDQVSNFDFEEVFIIHHQASVSPVWLDSDGRPIDAWGMHFRVTFDSGFPIEWVECSSAGMDKTFGTEDDIVYRSNRF